MDFNPRPLAGATHNQKHHQSRQGISIHAPLRGRRAIAEIPSKAPSFQSTPPCGGDMERTGCRILHLISIHAPLRGRHNEKFICLIVVLFQSTPPCGGDNRPCCKSTRGKQFQSTPPCGGDLSPCVPGCLEAISIHAPLRGRLRAASLFPAPVSFQSTPPCGGDDVCCSAAVFNVIFQSTPPCGGDPSSNFA